MNYNYISSGQTKLVMTLTTGMYLERCQISAVKLVKEVKKVRNTLLNHTVKFKQLSTFWNFEPRQSTDATKLNSNILSEQQNLLFKEENRLTIQLIFQNL